MALAKKSTTGPSSPNTGWSDGGAGPRGRHAERQCRQMPCITDEQEQATLGEGCRVGGEQDLEGWGMWFRAMLRREKGRGSGHTKPGAIVLERQGRQMRELGRELEAAGAWALQEAGAARLKMVFHRGGWIWVGSDQRQGCEEAIVVVNRTGKVRPQDMVMEQN